MLLSKNLINVYFIAPRVRFGCVISWRSSINSQQRPISIASNGRSTNTLPQPSKGELKIFYNNNLYANFYQIQILENQPLLKSGE